MQRCGYLQANASGPVTLEISDADFPRIEQIAFGSDGKPAGLKPFDAG